MGAVIRDYFRLPPKVLIVAFGRLLNSMGSFVVLLVTPLLIQHLGMSPVEAGVWLFACRAAFLAGTIGAGALLDRWSKVWILGGTLLLNAVAFAVGAVTDIERAVGVALVVGYFFHGAWRPSMAAIAGEETDPEQHATAFSLLYLVHNIGYIAAPIAAGRLFAVDPRFVFGGDAVSSVLSAAVVLVGTGALASVFTGRKRPVAVKNVHDSSGPSEAGLNTDGAPRERFLSTFLGDRSILLFAAASILGQLTYAQHDFALPLQLIEDFGESGTARFAVIMALNAGVVIVLTPLLTAAAKGLTAIRSITIGTVCMLVGFGMLRFVHTYPLYLLSTVVWTVGEILNAIHTSVFIVSRAPVSMRGRYVSVLPVIFSAGSMLSPILAGALIQVTATRAVWPAASIASGISVLLLLRAARTMR